MCDMSSRETYTHICVYVCIFIYKYVYKFIILYIYICKEIYFKELILVPVEAGSLQSRPGGCRPREGLTLQLESQTKCWQESLFLSGYYFFL